MKRTAGTTLTRKPKAELQCIRNFSTTDNSNRDGVHHLNQEGNKFQLYSTTNIFNCHNKLLNVAIYTLITLVQLTRH